MRSLTLSLSSLLGRFRNLHFFAHVHAVVWCVTARREAQMGAQRLQGSELGDCMSEEDKGVEK